MERSIKGFVFGVASSGYAVASGAMHEILTPEQMYAADRLAVARGISSLKLMEAAGRAVAAEVMKRFTKRTVAVLCGPGNNGGDGYVVARALKAKGWTVRVYALNGSPKPKSDAAEMAAKWKGPVGTFDDFQRNIGGRNGPRLFIDAIYGAGLNREMPGRYADGMHGAGVPIVSVDMPSGIDGLTGDVRGAAPRADVTVTFFRKKPGHILLPGRSYCGEVVVADIGIPADVADELPIRIYENAKPHLPVIHDHFHKFNRGHAVVWSGPALSTGAARLAAHAAARSGAGLTSIAGPRDALLIHAAHVSSIMLKPAETPDQFSELLSDKRITAVCIGPAAGVGETTRKLVLRALKSNAAVVLDADALRSFSDDSETLFAAIKAKSERDVVMTPHDGEFQSLFKDLNQQLRAKHERAQAAAARSGARIIYKGADTVIANPNGFATINTNAPAKLATAGSGDVLAGLVTGLLAQGMDAYNAACAAVWLHGDAANRIARRSIIAENLIAALDT
jgi:ADP-dependent NAD(P)H-hydrate dehydratase / NAD(P)H-hydrate epimerase